MSTEHNPECPFCGSHNVAKILWGEPIFTEDLERELKSKTVVLGGCCIAFDSPEYHCNDCNKDFGEIKLNFLQEDRTRLEDQVGQN